MSNYDQDQKLWSKHWISSGTRVVHEKHKDDDKCLTMTVDHLMRRSVQVTNDDDSKERKRIVVGVKCHWFDKEDEYRTGRFNTNELYPYEIIKSGQLETWLKIVYNQDKL